MKRLLTLTVLVTAFSMNTALAEDPVYFADLNLKAEVEEKLDIKDPTPSDMLNLLIFHYDYTNVTDITGLEYAVNLQDLSLRWDEISNISKLAGLIQLQKLNLSRNNIQDISALSAMTNLTYLNLHENEIRGISSLSSLNGLQYLSIHGNKISNISALAGMTNLTTLFINGNDIHDITPLTNCINLQSINMSDNKISNISALANMSGLGSLIMLNNDVSDISPLAGLSNLQTLALQGNNIHNVSPLAGLASMNTLILYHNPVVDISPLCALSVLIKLDLNWNSSLNAAAYCHDLQTIYNNNPGIMLTYQSNTQPVTGVYASDGIYPDKVRITWDSICNGPCYTSYYQVSRASAPNDPKIPISQWQQGTTFEDMTALPGIKYYYWVQCATDTQGSSAGRFSSSDTGWVLNSISSVYTLYVNNNHITDPNENGTLEHPFDTIQEAIDLAPQGTSIIIYPGTYEENINLSNKHIKLIGIDSNIPDYPLIKGDNIGSVITLNNSQDTNCVLIGLNITGGNTGVHCIHSSPTIKHCIVEGTNGPGILCQDSNTAILHCILTGNTGALVSENSQVRLSNCILWNNNPQSIMVTSGTDPLITYSNIQELDISYAGNSNIDTDPLFADPGYWQDSGTPEDPNDDIWMIGDYHLQSQAGCWDPITHSWVQDEQTSPCIDAGDPNCPVGLEPIPHGDIVNMGAYGSTIQASKSTSD